MCSDILTALLARLSYLGLVIFPAGYSVTDVMDSETRNVV